MAGQSVPIEANCTKVSATEREILLYKEAASFVWRWDWFCLCEEVCYMPAHQIKKKKKTIKWLHGRRHFHDPTYVGPASRNSVAPLRIEFSVGQVGLFLTGQALRRYNLCNNLQSMIPHSVMYKYFCIQGV